MKICTFLNELSIYFPTRLKSYPFGSIQFCDWTIHFIHPE